MPASSGRHSTSNSAAMNALSRLETGIDSWNEWRDRYPEDPIDLSNQDLSHGYFFEGNFRGVNLKGANLQRACLIGADLRQADLTDADLTGAYLGDANLDRANLAGANLTDANLDRADLRRTNLLGTRIVGADIRTAQLPNPNVDPYMDNMVELIAERRRFPRSEASQWPAEKRAVETAYRTANYRQSLLHQMIDHLPTLTRGREQASKLRQQAIRQSAVVITKPAKPYQPTASTPTSTPTSTPASAPTSTQKSNRIKANRQNPWGRRQADKKLSSIINRQIAQNATWIAAGLLLAVSLPIGFAKVNAPPMTAQAVTSLALAKSLTGSSQVWAVVTHSSATEGSLVVGGGDNGEIEIWNGQTGEFVRRIEGHKGAVRALAMSNSGKWLVSGGKEGVKVWQPETGQLKYTLPEAQASVRAVAISPDEETFISSDRSGNIIAWQISTGEQMYQIENDAPVWSIAIAPDSQSFITGGGLGGTQTQLNQPLKQWDLASGQLLQTFAGHDKAVRSVAISPDGQTLASGSTDETIKLWDLASGRLKTTLEGHKDGILSLAISPDGQMLASSSTDQTLKLWNLPSQQLTETFENSSTVALAFSPDSQTLVSGGQDQRINIWQ